MTRTVYLNRKATVWAWSQQLQTPSKVVLLALAMLARGPEHRVNLSATAAVDELASLTGLSRRAVRVHLRRLQDSDHVVAEERVDATGARLANRWHLNVDGLAPVPLPISTAWKGDPWPTRSPTRHHRQSPPAPGSTSMPPELPGMPETSGTASS